MSIIDDIIADIVSWLLELIGGLTALGGGVIFFTAIRNAHNQGDLGVAVATLGISTGGSIAVGGLAIMALGVIIGQLRAINRKLAAANELVDDHHGRQPDRGRWL